MANSEHVALILQGADAWNAWRDEDVRIIPDLSGADLRNANLNHADLSWANLAGIRLNNASLFEAKFVRANLVEAKLADADLSWTVLTQANLTGADLTGADLTYASLVETNFTDATLTGCYVYGTSAWGLALTGAKQQSLIVTKYGEPDITVDNIEVAQFIYLLLHNPKIRDVIDTVGKKAVLILGRFAPAQKEVLDGLRDELRKRDYVPILFDFEGPTSQNTTATVLTLARLSRFIIADLTNPSSIPYELARIVPDTKIPVQPLISSGSREFSMFGDLQTDYPWVLPIHHYGTSEELVIDLTERVITPAEQKILELRRGKPI
jgi:hypothetical protein